MAVSSPALEPQHLMHGLSFDQLHTVRTIVSAGSFHEAGKVLCLTQPAISQRVRHIERMLGAPIFDRHAGIGVSPTPVGGMLLAFCDRAIRALDEFSAELESVRAPSGEAEFGIAAPGNLIEYMLVPMLQVLQNRQPHLTVRLRQAAHNDLVTMTANGKVDVAIDRSPAHPSLVTVARMTEQLHLIAPAGHELLSLCPRDRPATIGKYPFANYTVGLRTRDLIQRWAAKVGAVIVPQVESRNVAALKAAALDHGALSILPVLAVRDEVRAGKLVLVEIADMPLRRVAVVTAKPGDERSRNVRGFVDELIAFSERNPDSFTVEVSRTLSQ